MATEAAVDDDEIFRRLSAPFEPGEVRTREQGGRTLAYITPRTARKRLNEVLGPAHWWPALTAAEKWVRCALTIVLPDGRTLTREALGGYPRMPSEEDAVKGGDSDAFKRAAALFGVGEYLYGDETAYVDGYGREAAPRPAPRSGDGDGDGPPGGEPRGRVWSPWVQWFYRAENDRWSRHLEAHRVDREERSLLVQHPEEVVNLVASLMVRNGLLAERAIAKSNGARDPGKARAAVADLFARAPKKVKARVREHFRGIAEAECRRLGIALGPYAPAGVPHQEGPASFPGRPADGLEEALAN